MIYPLLYAAYYIVIYLPLTIFYYLTGVNIIHNMNKISNKCMGLDVSKGVNKINNASKSLTPDFEKLNINFTFDLSKWSKDVKNIFDSFSDSLINIADDLDPSNINFGF